MTALTGRGRVDPLNPAPPAPGLARYEPVFWAAYYPAHVVLALAVQRSATLSTLHAMGTLALGMVCALSGRLDWTVRAVAYLVGAEVLWRMTLASVPYEIGKIALAGLLLAAVVRTRRYANPGLPSLPLAFFVLLLPAVVKLSMSDDLSYIRKEISFYLAGPFSLMASMVFFHGYRFAKGEPVRVLRTMVGPLTSVLIVVLTGIAEKEDLTFSADSNFQTSGGFGPNQVSAILGLGAVCCFLIILTMGRGVVARIFFAGLMLAFLGQSLLTFSRSGMYYAVGSILVGALRLLEEPRLRSRTLAILLGSALVLGMIIFPFLDQFTGGALGERYQDTQPTGRDELARADIEIWQDHPLLGIGPGQSVPLHAQRFRAVAAHTEYTRLLAEHGAFGLVALVLMLIMGYRNVVRARSTNGKALATALTVWSFLFMSGSAMRMAAPSFFIGFSSAFRNDGPEDDAQETSSTGPNP